MSHATTWKKINQRIFYSAIMTASGLAWGRGQRGSCPGGETFSGCAKFQAKKERYEELSGFSRLFLPYAQPCFVVTPRSQVRGAPSAANTRYATDDSAPMRGQWNAKSQLILDRFCYSENQSSCVWLRLRRADRGEKMSTKEFQELSDGRTERRLVHASEHNSRAIIDHRIDGFL